MNFISTNIFDDIQTNFPDKLNDNIYLGDEHSAQQLKNLQKLEITHVIVAGNFLQEKYPNVNCNLNLYFSS